MNVAVALSIAAVTAAPAGAQQWTGTLIPNKQPSALVDNGPWPTAESKELLDGEDQPLDAAVATGRLMAACTLRGSSGLVKAWLDADTLTRLSLVQQKLQPIMQPCLGKAVSGVGASSIKMPTAVMHGLFSEAYFIKYGVPTLESRQKSILANDTAFAEMSALLRVATCLTYVQPTLTKVLLSSVAMSASEKAAVSALVPHLSECIDNNVSMKVKTATLRLGIASATYRRMREPKNAAIQMVNK